MKRDFSQVATEGASSSTDEYMFETLAAWIRKEGGFVHPAVNFDHAQRVLRVSSEIPKGEDVLRIPRSVLICPSNILGLKEKENSYWRDFQKELVRETSIESSDDALVAVFLACKSPFFQQYLNSLPSRKDLDCIPRRMTPRRLEALLGGSPLIKRVHDQRELFQREHKAILQLLQSTSSKLPVQSISYDDFDDAMTIITSRAFAGKSISGQEETTLVPLLDLCNHERGALSQKKNLTYQFDSNMVNVRSCGIENGESLRITYGAQGNQQLLFNYGFAIPNNYEPDGSSNDAYEFFPQETSKVSDTAIDQSIFLRMGPKSYSYGCFVQALETFFESPQKSIGALDDNEEVTGTPEEDDMEAFLNGCDEEEDQAEDDDVDYGADAGCLSCSDLGCDGSLSHSKDAELRALSAFRKRLVELALSYNMGEIERKRLLEHPGFSMDYFAAVLVDSELTTLHFFAKTTEVIAEQLNNKTTSKIDKLPRELSERALNMKYVQDLAESYLKIRHGLN